MNHRLIIGAFLLGLAACAKKEQKPLRTEPWLAHPSASAPIGNDAGLKSDRYALDEQSRLRIEMPGTRGSVRGSITRLQGQIQIDPDDLSRTRAQVFADLNSLNFEEPSADGSPTLLSRARAALELDKADSPFKNASFELSALEQLSALRLESSSGILRNGGTRPLRAVAVGNLLLHGFRVQERVPVEVELGPPGTAGSAAVLSIRSRAPLVVSLETHAISVISPHEADHRHSERPLRGPREVWVTIEIHAIKLP